MAEGRQIPHQSEAIVLRTWPFHEADLLVSLFTREQGKVKGVARHAMRSRRRFGGALEPGTHVLANYTERPKQDLVRMDGFEILWSPLSQPVDWQRAAGIQLVAEVLEEIMPEGAADDNVFRLALVALSEMREGRVWLPVTYFCTWMNRLMGWWPDLGHCLSCGLDLHGVESWWSAGADGVSCGEDRRPGSVRLAAESLQESLRMQRSSLAEIAAEAWPAARLAGLERGLGKVAVGVLERHLERRLRSAAALG